jgi:signal transduction histidine kinase
VADGSAAWERLQAGSFDLALLDIDMPHFNGFELLKMIRRAESLSRLPVVMVTGREDVKSIDTAFRLGATSFVTKPVNWRQLSYQLQYVLRMSRMEQAARAAFVRAEEVSTLKSNLLAVLGHEFRTPLNTIIGFADLITDESRTSSLERCREYAAHIVNSGQRLLQAHLETMNYAQIIASEYQLVEDDHTLISLMASAMDPIQKKAAEIDVRFEASLDCRDASLLCDRQQIVRMLRHLMDNAIVHGGGGSIRSGVMESGEPYFDIVDCGPGIAPDVLRLCCAPFVQADMSWRRRNQGLGLGLPVAIRIAELHGGRLTVENADGGGTRVRVTLPADRLFMRTAA